MSYYAYLNRYPRHFLRRYQTEEYANLGRTSQHAELVSLNATSSLTIDEDLSLRWKVPYTLAGFLGFAGMVYWYMYHVNLFTANTMRNRMRSYHNYKMWARLEVLILKHNIEKSHPINEALRARWFRSYNITPDEFATFQDKVKEGGNVEEALAEVGLRWDSVNRVMVKRD
jgi:hypothetical protein